MALEKRQKELNGRVYALLTPPVRQAMPLCTKVAVLLGPILGALGGSVEKGGREKFGEALQGIDPASLDTLMLAAVQISKLSCNHSILTDDTEFERHFGEYPEDLYPICIWAIWECTRDFLPKSATSLLSKKILEKVAEMSDKKESQSQPDGQ